MCWRRGQAYGQDLRDRVLACGDEPIRLVAARFSVSASYVAKVRGRLRETGSSEPGPQCNHVPPRLSGLSTTVGFVHDIIGPRGGRARCDDQRVAPVGADGARRADQPPGDVA